MALESKVVVFLYVLCSAVLVCSLKCYRCNSMKDGQECTSLRPNTEKFLEECFAPNNKTCSKQDQWVEFEVLNQRTERRVIRECSSTAFTPGQACYYRAGFGGKANACYCTDSACNSAPHQLSCDIALVLVFMLALKIALI